MKFIRFLKFINKIYDLFNIFMKSVRLPKIRCIKKSFLQNFKIPISFSKFSSVINLYVHFNIFAKSVEVPKI